MRAAILNSALTVTAIEDWQRPHLPSYVIPSATARVGDVWDGSSFATPPAAPLSPQHRYLNAIAAGCHIVSIANPSLNGTYRIDDASLAKLTAVAAGIGAGKGLPGGGGTFNLFDQAGASHAIGAADFLNLAAALETYVYDLIVWEAALLGGHPATLPGQPVPIP